MVADLIAGLWPAIGNPRGVVTLPMSGNWRHQISDSYKANRKGAMRARALSELRNYWEGQGGAPLRWTCCPATPPVPAAHQTFFIETFVEF
ncbi:MAG: hypothetical protein CL862_12590 [Cyanobium sp. NAT70]|nr:hypothetical protein [Cyanobium sp. NAT70]